MKHATESATLSSLDKIIAYSEAFYQQLDLSLSREHYQLFIRHLPASLRGYFLLLGFERTKRSSLFRRFVLEARGQYLHSYLAERLSREELQLWQQQDQYYKNLLTKVNSLPPIL